MTCCRVLRSISALSSRREQRSGRPPAAATCEAAAGDTVQVRRQRAETGTTYAGGYVVIRLPPDWWVGCALTWQLQIMTLQPGTDGSV